MAGEDSSTPGPSTASKETQHPELSVRSSSLLHELTSLPLVKSLGSLYTTTRNSHWLLKSGLGAFEDTCSLIIEKLHIGSAFAIKMDKTAGEGLTKLKERYPSITTPTDEMVQSSKDQGAFLFHKTIRKIFRTYPGQVALNIFDWSVNKADRLLRRVSPPVRSPRKRKVTRASVKKIQEEHAYASEDSGTCEATEKLTKTHKAPDTTGMRKEPSVGILGKLFQLGIVFPLEASVSALKRVRRYLHAVSQKKRKLEKINISPEKEREIKARRKVSPKKKKPVSLLDQVRQSAFSVFGYKGVRHIHIEKSELDVPNREETEKKRKHDEILTDQGSEEESDDEDLVYFDLDNYESEDDPDYEPSDWDVVSDEDISDAETESDIETENVGGKGYFLQLKEKPGEKQQGEHKSAEIPQELPKDTKRKSSNSEKSSEVGKDKAGKPDEKAPDLPKDTKNKPQHSEKMPKSPGLPKDAKSKAHHQEKMPEPSKDKKHDSKSPDWPKETLNKTPQSDKLLGSMINGDKKPESVDKHKTPQADKKPELSKEAKGKAAPDKPV